MARLTIFTLLLIVMVCCACAPSLDARKLLNEKNESVMEGNVRQSALVEGPTPPSTGLSEKLFALHLAHLDRILHSVPSPGAGH